MATLGCQWPGLVAVTDSGILEWRLGDLVGVWGLWGGGGGRCQMMF